MIRISSLRIAWRKQTLGSLVAAAALSLFYPQEAKAILDYNIFQSGSNVVISTSGSLNLASSIGGVGCQASGALLRQVSLVCTGVGGSVPKYSVTLQGSDGLFNNGIGPVNADSVTGTYSTTLFGLQNRNDTYFATNAPTGTSIISTTTFNNKTLASLGFTSYGLIGTWRLNSTNDLIRFTVVQPVPGPLPLLGAGAAFGWSRRLRRRIGTKAKPPIQR